MNLNKMARDITLQEGGKISVSIAQVKEIMRIFLQELADYSDDEILTIVDRYRR